MAEVRRRATTHKDEEETTKQKRSKERGTLAKSHPCLDMPRGVTIHPRF